VENLRARQPPKGEVFLHPARSRASTSAKGEAAGVANVIGSDGSGHAERLVRWLIPRRSRASYPPG
jgi:hypothetical protein